MTTQNIKELKSVIIFLSILGMMILGSFLVDKKEIDILYLLFIISCMIRYIIICNKK